MTNELGTTLEDIETQVRRKKAILGRLKTATDLLRMYDNAVNGVVITAISDAYQYIEEDGT